MRARSSFCRRQPSRQYLFANYRKHCDTAQHIDNFRTYYLSLQHAQRMLSRAESRQEKDECITQNQFHDTASMQKYQQQVDQSFEDNQNERQVQTTRQKYRNRSLPTPFVTLWSSTWNAQEQKYKLLN